MIRLRSAPDEIEPNGEWIHVAGVLDFKNNRMALYKNGALIEQLSPASFESDVFVYDGIANAVIGSEDDGTVPADGRLDNLFISNIPRSEDWIKLSYATQKPDRSIVSIYP